MRAQLERVTKELKDLNEQTGHVGSDFRERAEKVAHGVWERIRRLVSGEQPKENSGEHSPAEEEVARARRRREFEDARHQKTRAKSAWMPQTPVPPYRATLAVAPAMPAPADVNIPRLPENWDELDDTGKTKALEEFLAAFHAEHKRIVGEHDSVMNQLTEQIKERKLQALRESLN